MPVVQPMPQDLKVIGVITLTKTMLGGMMGPFVTPLLNYDLPTAAFVGSLINVCGLFGSFLLSRCSDRFSRRSMLLVCSAGTCIGTIISILSPESIIWILAINSFAAAGFSSIVDALVCDHCISMGASVAEISAWLGRGLLLCGVAVTVSPAIGLLVASSLEDMSFICNVGSAILFFPLLLLSKPKVSKPIECWSAREFVDLKSVRTPAGLWYLSWTFVVVTIYNFSQTVLMPSLGTRFNADANMHGQLQTVTGLGIMLGTFLSGPIVKHFCNPHPTQLLSAFMGVTFAARIVMFTTPSFPAYLSAMFVYAVMGIGVIGPLRSSMPSQFVPGDELGGFMGLKQTVECMSGIVGPALAGVFGISLTGSALNLALLCCYAATPFCAYFGYPFFIQEQVEEMTQLRKERQN